MIPANKQQRVRFEANQRLDYEDLRDIGLFGASNLLAAIRAVMVPGGINGLARANDVTLGTGLQVKVTPPLAGVTSTGVIAIEAADGVQTLSISARDGTYPRIDLVEVGYVWETDASQARWHRDPANDTKTAPTQVTRERGKIDLKVKTGTPQSSPTAPPVDAGYLALAEVLVPTGTGTLVVTQRREGRVEPLVVKTWSGSGGNANFSQGVDWDTVNDGGYLDVTTPVGSTTLLWGSVTIMYRNVDADKIVYPQMLLMENTDGTSYGVSFTPSGQGINGGNSDLVRCDGFGIVRPTTTQSGKRYRMRLHYAAGRNNTGAWVNPPNGIIPVNRIVAEAPVDNYLVALTL